ncbi:MAG: bifunctional DNA-formamidopyrimidine glycosylase/DNA-(apurinic or apyrimidinic site) lyase [Candidatus Accumulibacter sp.]|jgi:formamidopyrimidine-DNA glycosylase|nr:bifunctional DNA-formamidopyrimidine glycosylase/DNA-(apurinic or apyrimidinic site) lyase [Accumulibacter sp.]
MPELPEVEVSRLGLLPHLTGRTIVRAVFRVSGLRYALPPELAAKLAGRRVRAILRRGKYLLFDCADESGRDNGNGGWLIVHLGMSGSLRLVAVDAPAQKHDHVDIVFPETVLRLRDPRRFGAVLWHEGADAGRHPAIAALGIEPLSPEFGGQWLYAATRRRNTPIKPWLMDGHVLAGIGNIYASEALFRAGVAPTRAAGRIGRERCHELAAAIRATLEESIAAGGSSVRDYVHSDGGAGSFQVKCAVYGRAGEPCRICGAAIRALRQAGRATFHCPRCQR